MSEPCCEGSLREAYGWLVEEHTHCTCGAGPNGYYGAHEQGCGLVPLADLATRCYRCGHRLDSHFEDGIDEPPTACAEVYGDRGCSCRGFIHEPEEPA
jgi:hypothetical protein